LIEELGGGRWEVEDERWQDISRVLKKLAWFWRAITPNKATSQTAW
jgi:hypothetical protein